MLKVQVLMSETEAIEVVHGISLRIKALERNMHRARRTRFDEDWAKACLRKISDLAAVRRAIIAQVGDLDAEDE